MIKKAKAFDFAKSIQSDFKSCYMKIKLKVMVEKPKFT